MSIEYVEKALNAPISNAKHKLVLIGLAFHAHADGTNAFPTVARLAFYAHCSERTVQRALNALRRDGWISPMQSSLPAYLSLPVTRRPNCYCVNLSKVQKSGEGKMSPRKGRGDSGGRSGASKQCRKPGDKPVSPKPTSNRQSNHHHHDVDVDVDVDVVIDAFKAELKAGRRVMRPEALAGKLLRRHVKLEDAANRLTEAQEQVSSESHVDVETKSKSLRARDISQMLANDPYLTDESKEALLNELAELRA